MSEAATLLRVGIGLSFVLLGMASARAARSARVPAGYSLAAALGLVGVTALLGQAGRATEEKYPIIVDLALGCFAASGYFLLRFRAGFVPLSRRANAIAAAAVIGVVAWAMAAPLPPDASTYSAWQIVQLLSVVVVWAACVGEPTVRFWLASRDRPVVQRARLRSLSGGYGLLIATVFVIVVVQIEGPHPAITLGSYGVVLLLVPVLYASFAPPGWLRRVWRAREQDIFRPIRDLGAFAPDREVTAERALDLALRMTGSDAGFIEYPEGSLLALRGMIAADRPDVKENDHPDAEGARVVPLGDSRRTAVVVPLNSEAGSGRLAVLSGPFTPFFGSDEVSRLEQYAEVVSVALERVGLSESLRQETQRSEALLVALSDLGEGFVISEAGRCVYANEAFCRMSGYSLDELRHLPSLVDLCPPDERDAIERRLQARLGGGEVEDHYEVGLVTKSGVVLRVETAVKLLDTDEGPRIVAIVRDVTYRKEAENALERQTASARLLKTIAVAANEASELEEVLQTTIDEVCAYTGWPVGHVYLPGSRADVLMPTQIWHLDDTDKYAIFRRVTEGTPFRHGEGLPGRVLKSGRPAWIPDVTEDSGFVRSQEAELIEVRGGFGFPILVGNEIAGVLEFYSDVPQAPDPELLDLMGQIGTQLGRVAERMRADALTRQFIANAAHELRTPITTVVGFANVLANRRENVKDSQLEEIFEALSRQSERLRELVNDLLDYTRVQQSATGVEVKAFPVRSLLDVVVTHTPAPEGKSLSTVVPDGLGVLAHRLHFDQILINLVTNAYRYGGDTVTIEAQEEDGFVEISVSDDGPGVTPSLIDHLFEPFARDTDSAYVGGSGLGLAIARLLSRAQGGDLRYEPRDSGGARFVVRLRSQS